MSMSQHDLPGRFNRSVLVSDWWVTHCFHTGCLAGEAKFAKASVSVRTFILLCKVQRKSMGLQKSSRIWFQTFFIVSERIWHNVRSVRRTRQAFFTDGWSADMILLNPFFSISQADAQFSSIHWIAGWGVHLCGQGNQSGLPGWWRYVPRKWFSKDFHVCPFCIALGLNACPVFSPVELICLVLKPIWTALL